MSWTETITRNPHTVVANIVVLFGVILFGWSASVLLIVYWVEAGVAIIRGAVQGAFAEDTPKDLAVDQRLPFSSWSKKRGSVSLSRLPPIYPRNIPLVVASIVVMTIFWPVTGAIVIVSVDTGFSIGSVLVGITSLLIGHSVSFVDYIINDRYTTASPRSALLRQQVLSVFALGVGGVIVFTYTSPPSVLLVFIVIVKLISELVFAGLSHTEPLTEWDDDSVEDRVPDTDSTEIFQISRWNLLVREIAYTPLYMLMPPYLFLTFVVILAGLIGGVRSALIIGFITIIITMICRIGVKMVQEAHVEYHVYSSHIVAYDTLLDTAQWTVRRSEVIDISVKPSRFDRIRPGGQTVVVSAYDTDYRLQALQNPDLFVNLLSE